MSHSRRNSHVYGRLLRGNLKETLVLGVCDRVLFLCMNLYMREFRSFDCGNNEEGPHLDRLRSASHTVIIVVHLVVE